MTTVNVVCREWSMTPNVTSIHKGKVSLVLENRGKITHEMVILKTNLPVNVLKVKPNGVEVDEEASGEVFGRLSNVGAGQTKTLSLNLSPGRYVLTCNALGHYRAGMVAELTVKS